MRKKMELIIVIALLASLIVLSKKLEAYVTSGKVTAQKNTVILDSGHGGSDPGKIGVNNALEKDLNLQVAKKVEKILKKKKIDVSMTREDDNMLCKEEGGNKKVQDMKARVELINKAKPALAVSIHQNSYQEESIHGAQVFYYTHSEDGKTAAEIMQEALLTVDPDNTRQAKANDTYYLLKRTESPIIIVECGFLSNQAEADKLVDEAYQQQMAEAIAKGIESYLGAGNNSAG